MTCIYKRSLAKNWTLSVLMFFVLVILLPGCKGKINNQPESSASIMAVDTVGDQKLRKVTFLPYWVTNAQFAGYYVADEMGIYKKHGIKVNILPYQPFITPQGLINEGKADFAALWLVNALGLQASGTDIVNITQLSLRSSLMLVTKKKSGINTLQDMNGKKAGIWSGFELQPRALFNKYKLNVKIVPIGSSNNLFLMDGVDFTNANWFDEYHSLINSGFNPEDLNTFFFADYGLNFPEDGIYCLSDKRKNEPELCADFVNATLEGWMYAFNNPEKAIDIVVKNALKNNQPVNRVHQRWMLDRYKDLYIAKGKNSINTILMEKDYQLVGKVLKDNGLVKQIPPFNDFYQPVGKHQQ